MLSVLIAYSQTAIALPPHHFHSLRGEDPAHRRLRSTCRIALACASHSLDLFFPDFLIAYSQTAIALPPHHFHSLRGEDPPYLLRTAVSAPPAASPWPVPLTALIYSSTVARTSVRLLWGVLSNFTHTSKTSLRSCCRRQQLSRQVNPSPSTTKSPPAQWLARHYIRRFPRPQWNVDHRLWRTTIDYDGAMLLMRDANLGQGGVGGRRPQRRHPELRPDLRPVARTPALSLLRRHQELGLPEALLRVSYSEHPPLPRPGAAPTTFYYIIPTLPQAGEGFLRINQC